MFFQTESLPFQALSLLNSRAFRILIWEEAAIVIGLAAVIIGEVIFGKIFKNFALKLIAAVIGGVIYYIVITLVVALGLPANDLKLFTAIVVAIFLGVPYWKNKVIRKKIKGGAANA